MYTVCKRPFGLFFFYPYIANIVMPCNPLIFTARSGAFSVKIKGLQGVTMFAM